LIAHSLCESCSLSVCTIMQLLSHIPWAKGPQQMRIAGEKDAQVRPLRSAFPPLSPRGTGWRSAAKPGEGAALLATLSICPRGPHPARRPTQRGGAGELSISRKRERSGRGRADQGAAR
jgi:hypothetical protein